MRDEPPDQPLAISPLKRIVEEAEQSLEELDASPFSDRAFTRLKDKVSEYTVQLIAESIKVSRRHQSEAVSTTDVEQASRYLVSSTRHKILKHVGTVGGILLGAGFSSLLAMMTVGQFTNAGIVAAFLLTAVGASMVAAHIAKD